VAHAHTPTVSESAGDDGDERFGTSANSTPSVAFTSVSTNDVHVGREKSTNERAQQPHLYIFSINNEMTFTNL